MHTHFAIPSHPRTSAHNHSKLQSNEVSLPSEREREGSAGIKPPTKGCRRPYWSLLRGQSINSGKSNCYQLPIIIDTSLITSKSPALPGRGLGLVNIPVISSRFGPMWFISLRFAQFTHYDRTQPFLLPIYPSSERLKEVPSPLLLVRPPTPTEWMRFAIYMRHITIFKP